MTVLITLVALIYVAGVIVVAFIGWSNWSLGRDMARSYDDDRKPLYLSADFIERKRAKYERESLEGARLFTHSPLWPLLALGVLAQILNDSKKDSTP